MGGARLSVTDHKQREKEGEREGGMRKFERGRWGGSGGVTGDEAREAEEAERNRRKKE